MVVYIEAVLLENFLIDGLLLYLALRMARLSVSWPRLLLGAILGAAEAALFPLLRLPVWAAYTVKLAGGVLLVLAAAKGRPRACLLAAAAFFALTFLFGGLLTALLSAFGAEYAEGNGYLVEKVPLGGLIAVFAIGSLLLLRLFGAFYRYRAVRRDLLPCDLRAGRRTVRWTGLADSGNCLSFRGEPVCVTSAAAVFALFGRGVKEEGRIALRTVNGCCEAPVFACDRLSVRIGGRCVTHEKVYLTVGDVGGDYQLILNPALMEA